MLCRWLLYAVILVLTCSCTGGGPWYYYESNLNALSVGMTKQTLLDNWYGGKDANGHVRAGLQIRAARRTQEGQLIEVGELPMMSQATTRITRYWFVFEDGRLVQWGRPEDWRAAATRYQIDFNPNEGIPR
jgi:hypothetical protein